MIMTIEEVLKEVHKQYVGGDTDYPGSDEGDFIFRLSQANNGIDQYEGEVSEGTQWTELISEYIGTATGTGIDDLASDHLSTYRRRDREGDHPAELYAGTVTYYEVSPGLGMSMRRNNLGGNVFWIAGKKLNTYPAISGSFYLPYLRNHTRYPLGTETTPIDMGRPVFLVYYILSMLCLKDRNAMGFQANQQLAMEEIRKMKLDANKENLGDGGFGIGM